VTACGAGSPKKRRVAEETMKSGASVSIVARRHDINANLVFSWRKLYQEGRLGVRAGEQSFIPVGVVGSQASVPVLIPLPGWLA
jgi:transposase